MKFILPSEYKIGSMATPAQINALETRNFRRSQTISENNREGRVGGKKVGTMITVGIKSCQEYLSKLSSLGGSATSLTMTTPKCL